MYNSTIEASVENSDGLMKALQAEMKNDAKHDRSSFDVRKERSKVIFEIKAKDATALRATLNSLTQLLSVYEKAESAAKGKK